MSKTRSDVIILIACPQNSLAGENIQASSSQRLWICLSNNDLEEVLADNMYRESLRSENDTYLGRCVNKLHAAGLPEESRIVAFGHSYGGSLALVEVSSIGV